ncbi:MAG TPA: phosphate ABC transporter substrate-binding protein [Thermoanaerobaculia bacterium]
MTPRPGRFRAPAIAALALLAVAACAPAPEEGGSDPGAAVGSGSRPLRVVGSTTVNPVVARAAEELAASGGPRIVVDTQGGSSGGIAALGEGRADVAMASRPIGDGDRERYPETDFRPVSIGTDAVAIVVSRNVWEGGVRSLSRDEMRGIYEERITDWSEVGGAPGRIVLFDKEPGRGTWEVFADWLYGDAEEAPLVSHLEVGSNEEGRTKTASTPGAITQLSAAWADGETVFALAIEPNPPAGGERPGGGGDTEMAPTPEAIAGGDYPMARPLLVVTDGEPSPAARELISFLLGPRGRELVVESGYLPPEVGGTS